MVIPAQLCLHLTSALVTPLAGQAARQAAETADTLAGEAGVRLMWCEHSMRGDNMLRLRIMVLISCSIILSGCAGRINNIMSSWEGSHYSDLIASWGPPQSVFEDGSGGRILVYTQVRSWTAPGSSVTRTTGTATVYDNYIWGSSTSRTTYIPPATYAYSAYRMFWINSNGFIYRWAWKGL